MIKYGVLKRQPKFFWQKKYLWVVYEESYGAYSSGWAWTRKAACMEAVLYIDKLNDGRFIGG